MDNIVDCSSSQFLQKAFQALAAFADLFGGHVKGIVAQDLTESEEGVESYNYNSCLEEADPDPPSLPEFQHFEVHLIFSHPVCEQLICPLFFRNSFCCLSYKHHVTSKHGSAH
jgi:hypothetical protein